MDSRTHRLLTVIRESAYDVRAGSERAADVHATLTAELNAIREHIPRQEVHQLEQLIDSINGTRHT